MTEPEVSNVITLNGKEYDSSKMNEQQRIGLHKFKIYR